MKIRGFEVVTKYKNAGINIPKRSTEHSAGYDIEAAETVSFAPGEIKLIPTGLKAYMQAGEVLYMYDRSSNPRKKGLVLINSVGVIDKDYYNNPDNEGHMFMKLTNDSKEGKTLEVGQSEGMVQGIFMQYGITEDDDADGVRNGGFGSTTGK